jgi:hypothetical protein
LADVNFGQAGYTSQPIFGGGVAYTYGTGGAKGSFVLSGGLQVYQTYAAGNATSGHLSLFEYRTPVTIGGSIGNFGFGGYFDYRQGIRTADLADPGNYNALAYGPYLRVGLGPRGSVPGKFALEGRYLWISGTFTGVDASYWGGQPGTTQDFDMANSHDLRVGLSFTPTPHWLLRAEYHDVQYQVDRTLYAFPGLGSFDQLQHAYVLTVGYIGP